MVELVIDSDFLPDSPDTSERDSCTPSGEDRADHVSLAAVSGQAPACEIAEPRLRRKTTAKRSPFFASAKIEIPSCLIFPERNASCFGLIQERLAHEPFQLLVAVIFLHQTKGFAAVPTLLDFLKVFPTAELLGETEASNVEPFIRHLGLQNKRAKMLVALARAWTLDPPREGRYTRYPSYGKHLPKGQLAVDAIDGGGYEIAHLPGIGPYALDSWRIFCRDALLGRNRGGSLTPLANKDDAATELAQEWTSVMPADKELRVYVQWRWCRLGWLWDPCSGRRMNVSDEILCDMENQKLDNHLGFRSPWLNNKTRAMREEQLLGGYHDED